MSNIINSRIRFGYTESSDMVYDYLAQRDVKPVASYASKDGTWNLLEVKRLILANQFIDSAKISNVEAAPPARLAPSNVTPIKPNPVAAAAAAGVTAATTVASSAAVASNPAATGMSAEQLTALKLSPIQMAALGLKHAALVTGVTASEVKGWGLTPARADALQLTAEQRRVLLP